MKTKFFFSGKAKVAFTVLALGLVGGAWSMTQQKSQIEGGRYILMAGWSTWSSVRGGADWSPGETAPPPTSGNHG
jgi:hypothetical protein